MPDVVALGELLIDFTPAGISQWGNPLFERNPGGAPANVLAALTRLGGSSAFIGKVGEDQFGYFLKDVLEKNNIDTKGLKFSKDANTTLAFVHLKEDGDRSFSFNRKPGADTLLSTDDIELKLIDEAKIFHFGSLSMTDEPSRSATIYAVEYAKSKGIIISYDPNFRPPLWKSEEEAKKNMVKGLEYADILKISETEMEFITGVADFETGTEMLYKNGIKLILVTLGEKGCFYRCSSGTGYVAAYSVKAVDTTGAGDSFLGSMLYQISKMDKPIEEIEKMELEKMIDFSNAVAALCVTKRGAIPAMPCREEVIRLQNAGRKY